MKNIYENITKEEIDDKIIDPEEDNQNENVLLISDNNFNLNSENERTEENIIMITNSCLDEQSFFKQNNDNLIKKETKLTKLSNKIVSAGLSILSPSSIDIYTL